MMIPLKLERYDFNLKSSIYRRFFMCSMAWRSHVHMYSLLLHLSVVLYIICQLSSIWMQYDIWQINNRLMLLSNNTELTCCWIVWLIQQVCIRSHRYSVCIVVILHWNSYLMIPGPACI
jgi:hypothetical protein